MRCRNALAPISLAVCWIFWGLGVANAQCTLPYQLSNGQVADATQVMANFNALVSCYNNVAPGGSANAIQYNGGSGNFGGVGPLTNGQVVIGATAGQPQAGALTAGSGIAIANGPGSITISTSGSGSYNGPPISQVTFGSGTTPIFGANAYLSTGTYNVHDGSTFRIWATLKKSSSSDSSKIDFVLTGSGNNTGIDFAIQNDGNFVVTSFASGSPTVVLAASGHPFSWSYSLPGFPNWAVIEAVVSFGSSYNGMSMMPLPYTNLSSSNCNFVGGSFSLAAQVDGGAIGTVWIEQLN